uniref:SSD domain-containing protein n=3 Tax=Parascaris univalens TaxID=6257 RepID=A0A915AL22_PARUN
QSPSSIRSNKTTPSAKDERNEPCYVSNATISQNSANGAGGSLTSSSNKSRSEKSSTVRYKSLNKPQQKSPELQKRQTQTLSSTTQLRNDAEEVRSEVSVSSNKKGNEKALVRRITNEMQIAQYDKCANEQTIGAAVTSNERVNERCSKQVYKMYAFRFVEAGLRRALWYLARAVAVRKILFALLPLVFVLLSLVGPIIHRENLHFTPPFSSFVSRSFDALPSSGFTNPRLKPTAIHRFNSSSYAYSALRRNSPSEFAILMRGRERSDSIIHEKTIDAYSKVRKSIQNIRVIFEKSNLTWSELCRESCTDENDVIKQIVTSDSKAALTFPEALVSLKGSSKNLTRLFLGLSIGGVETDVDGGIANARALHLAVRLKENFRPEILSNWDAQFRKRMREWVTEVRRAANIDLYWWSYAEFVDEVVSAFRKVHVALAISALILVIVCLFGCLASNAYQSKPVLGVIIGLVLIVCCLAGYSVQFAGVATLNVLIFPVFFIIAGIGSLTLFALESTWSKYSNAACDPVEKLSLIMCWDGSCSVIASLTVIIAFLVVGSSTASPYLQYVSFVLAAAVAMLLIFSLLCFTVFLFIGGRRETRGLKWYQCLQQGDNHFAPRTINEYSDVSISHLHDKLVEMKPSLTNAIASVTANPYMRCPVAFAFAIYLVFAFWGCKDLTVELREEFFISKSSESRAYIDNYREMFGRYEEYLELVFDEPLDYHDPHRKQDILALIDWPLQNQLATRSVSWLKDFARFESSTIYDINPDTFVPIVSLVFLTGDNFKKYQSDVSFDKYQTQIIASKMYIELSAKGVQQRLYVIDGLLSRARAAGIPLSIRVPFAFSVQHDLQVMSTIVVAFAILLCCICGLSLFLYGIPSLTALVLLSNLSVIIGVVGYAVYWNIPINIITLSIAFSGDALTTVIMVYFCYHYATAGKSQKSGEQRVQYSFQSCLLPVTLACFIPLITYLPLLYIDVPIILHIFKILLLTSIISYAHFLLFLPSVMMFFTEQIPSFCMSMQGMCDDCCCYCFEMEEDAGSIYFIPTGGRSIDADHLHNFSRQYSYALSAPPQGMILPPPPGYLHLPAPVLVPDVLPYHRGSTITNVDGYRSVSSARRDSYSERSSATSPQAVRSKHETPRSERHSKAPPPLIDEHCINEDSIYEEPPSPPAARPQTRSVERSPHLRDRRSLDRLTSTRFFHDDHADGEPAIEMQSNWRQYLLEGSFRQTSTIGNPQPVLYYPTPSYRKQPARYSVRERNMRY